MSIPDGNKAAGAVRPKRNLFELGHQITAAPALRSDSMS
jgi:hypothetical protein